MLENLTIKTIYAIITMIQIALFVLIVEGDEEHGRKENQII